MSARADTQAGKTDRPCEPLCERQRDRASIPDRIPSRSGGRLPSLRRSYAGIVLGWTLWEDASKLAVCEQIPRRREGEERRREARCVGTCQCAETIEDAKTFCTATVSL